MFCYQNDVINAKIFFPCSINQSINQFICFVLQNEKYTNICEKKKKVFESTGRQRNDHTVF